METMRKAEKIVDTFSPVLTYSGKKELILAIKRMAQVASANGFDDILVTKDIYPAITKAHASLATAERALYRAIDFCWMNGNNEALSKIIGKKLPCKPQPALFIMYCAYFYIYNEAYHKAAEKELPLLF